MMPEISKQILTMAILVVSLSIPTAVRASSIVTLVDTNPFTGIAMDSYDPVSYFTETSPLEGSPAYEFEWSGVPWQFANAANMAIFARAPEIYAPQYGGYGAMGVARGYLAHGDPRFYAVFKQRLYLFYSAANREAFLMAPDRAAHDGLEHWKELSEGLSTR